MFGSLKKGVTFAPAFRARKVRKMTFEILKK